MAKSKANIVKFFHSDAGHGWLAVKTRELADLGIADKITAFSYTKGKSSYLEEDVDMALYINTQRDSGVTVEVRQGKRWDKKSPIRAFPSYQAPVTQAPVVETVVTE
jgi:hypothetical protein